MIRLAWTRGSTDPHTESACPSGAGAPRLRHQLAMPGSARSVRGSGHDEAVDALELIVDEGRPANAGRFFQLGHDLLALLDELSDVPVAWRITSLRTGSALATVAPPVGQPEEARVLRLAYASLGFFLFFGGLPD